MESGLDKAGSTRPREFLNSGSLDFVKRTRFVLFPWKSVSIEQIKLFQALVEINEVLQIPLEEDRKQWNVKHLTYSYMFRVTLVYMYVLLLAKNNLYNFFLYSDG